MYFSKNSRYVLQKAQWLKSSSCLFTFLKGNEKCLSAKYPKDDPTKPPLRKNIPKDTITEYYPVAASETRKRDISEQRSRSLISRSTNPSAGVFHDGLLPRSESEIQLPNFTPEEYILKSEKESGVNSLANPLPFQTSDGVVEEIFLGGTAKNVDSSGNSDLLYTNDKSGDKFYAHEAALNQKGTSASGSTDLENPNYKIVHIIIDFPQKNEENTDEILAKAKESVATQSSTSFAVPREKKQPEVELAKLKQARKWRSKSVSKTSSEPNRKRFEVHEIEDSGTFVLHLKLKNTTGVAVVPEKEVRTRKTTTQDYPVPDTLAKSLQKPKKEASATDETQEVIRYLEKKKKKRKSKHPKLDARSKSFSFPHINPSISDNVQAKEFLEWQQPQYYELPVSDSFEEKKILKSFTKDDSGTIRSPANMLMFKAPKMKEEEEPEEVVSMETTATKNESVAEMEPATEQRNPTDKEKALAELAEREKFLAESPDKEKVLTEAADREQEMEAEEAERESGSQVKDEEFEMSSYDDPPPYSERPAPVLDDSRPPPTDWVVPNFMHSSANHQLKPVTEMEEKPRKKAKKYPLTSKKGKGKKKKSYVVGSKMATTSERYEFDMVDFKNAGSSVPIKCDKPTYAVKLSAAYPPLLNEAMKRRYYRYRSNSMDNRKTVMSLQSKDFELNPKCLNITPKKPDTELGLRQKDGGSNTSINVNVPKISDNICNIANENITLDKGMASLDSLAMMKKVKEIVDLDLNNAIKIFKSDFVGEVSSVLVNKDGEWVIDEKELKKCIMIRKSEFLNDIKRAESTGDFFGDRRLNLPKYFPPTKESQAEIKLDHSVVTFNPDTNKFVIDVEDLQEAIKRRTEESFDDVVVEKLEGLLTGSKAEPILVFSTKKDESLKLKSGDSILVFDEETQKWKVDYSILEKREQQLRVEEELAKRSEFILETIEKIEKSNMPSIPNPETRDRKTFDYNKEQWKDYGSGKKSTKKGKSPFKESDAKEIRKKNSDLYDDLFMKKDKTKKCDGVKPTEGKLCKGENEKETGTMTDVGVPPAKPGTVPEEPEPVGQRKESPGLPENKAEDDNYWEAFLNMTIPPRDIKEMPKVNVTQKPKIRAPGPPPPQPSGPPSPPTPPVSSPPGPKVEDPKFKIHFPFTGDFKKKKEKDISRKKPKDDKPKAKAPASPGANEKPKLKPPEAPSNVNKQKEPKSSVPSPTQPPTKKKEEPKAKPPPPPPQPPTPKKEEPKPPAPTKKDDVKEKLNPPKKGETDVPPQKEPPKTSEKNDPKVKASSSSSIKPKDPKSGTKKDKSAADHYISENIVELSRNSKEKNSKAKPNKIETVKLNITADRRVPSKVMEINLNKKRENPKESSAASKSDSKNETVVESRIFYKKFEKYKTPFSDPEYEEKSMKIKSDMASNPNLKKLGNWNKTLVLHDIAKPPENIENWLKDETDKMATLLLKVLQEASDGKPRRKSSRTKLTDKGHAKANPYDNIRKKQETTSNESFLFKVRPVDLSLENKKKADQVKTIRKSESVRNVPFQKTIPAKPAKVSEVKTPEAKNDLVMTSPSAMGVLSDRKPLGLETTDPFLSRDFLQQYRLAGDITDDIPGPELLKRISNTWKIFPVFSAQMTIFTLLRLFQLVNLGKSFLDSTNPDISRRQAFSKLFAKYGPIVNVQGPLSGSVILIHKPEHLSAVFEQDASIPVRSVFDSLEHSRRETEEKYLPAGIYTEWNAPQWRELKKHTNDPLVKGREKFFATVEAAGSSLVSNIQKNKNHQNYASEDFMEEIKRWSLEGLCNVLFEKSFGFLEGRSKNMSWILEPDKLFMSVDEATSYLSKCERGFQTWRLMTTPSAIGLKQSYRTLSGIIAKQLYQAEANLKNKSEALKENKMYQSKDLTFLESMLLNDGMTPDEITCNLIDILLIGTNAMSSALGFLLYDLSQNVKVQNKLISEVREVLPEKNSLLDYQKFHSLRYLQACLKESLRLHMPVPIFYRMLQNDILLSNYIVPKGTYVVMDYRVSCMKDQIFDEPEKFHPERWLEDEKWIENFHPFATLPLCHGPRAELAKRVVEMQILTCAAKIVRNFHVEYQFGEIQGTDAIISFPDKPLKFNFVEREI